VKNEKLGVKNEKLGVKNEKLGVKNEKYFIGSFFNFFTRFQNPIIVRLSGEKREIRCEMRETP